jgi:predicted porin
MKKTLIALAALGVVGAASAQVAIDGQIELGVVNTSAAGTQLDAGNGGSQIRIKANEDLGGGMSAFATMALRFSPESGLQDGGAGNRPTFQGESTVGISGEFGSIKIGRALPALMIGSGATDPWGQRQQAHTGLLTTGYASDADNIAGSGSGLGRTDAFHYTSPTVSGINVMVSAGLKRSASTGAGTDGAGGFTSYWASYSANGLTAGFGSETNRTGDRVTAYLATYDLGMAKIGFGSSNVSTVANAGQSKGRNANYMLVVPMGALTATAGLADMKAESTAARSTKMGIGAAYALSKRTRLYTTYGSTKTKATGVIATGYDFGITHTF